MSRSLVRDLLKASRSRTKEFQPLSRDPWIRTNSDLAPQKLHALGVIIFRWNLSENKLFVLFADLLRCPIEEAHVLAHELGDVALMTRIKVLAYRRIKNDEQLLDAIANASQVYDVCRQNRNQLTHFGITLVPKDETPRAHMLGLARKTKSPEYQKNIPFPDRVKDLRRVARDIRRLNAQLEKIYHHIRAKWNPGAATELSRSLLSKLPLPELLWKPHPLVPTKPAPPPKSSRASRHKPQT